MLRENHEPVAGYDPGDFHDEAFEAPGRPRAAYADLLAALDGRDLAALTEDVNRLLADRGVRFGGEQDGHPFRVDPVPRLVSAEEWAGLAAGLRQRARALDAFVADVYGAQRAVAEGVVPGDVVAGSAYFEPDLAGVELAGPWVGLAGLDVVRGGDGRFHVLEDNARTPSGLAYAMAASDAVAEVLGVHRSRAAARAELRHALRGALAATAPHLDGELVLLTDGPENSAYYEHRCLAEVAELELVRPDGLRRRGDHLELGDGRRVRAVYRRTDEAAVRDGAGRLSPAAELLLEPMRAGTVGVLNPFGTGVADNKVVYAYVDELVRLYLGEEPVVGSIPTHDLRDEQRRAEVLDRLDEVVVKPRDGQGGEGVVVGPTAGREELAAARRAVAADPDAWIVQDLVPLSTHPTVVDGGLAPRHVDLRPFTFHHGSEVVVPAGGLTRVALQPGSMVVNSSRDGGGKATWVG